MPHPSELTHFRHIHRRKTRLKSSQKAIFYEIYLLDQAHRSLIFLIYNRDQVRVSLNARYPISIHHKILQHLYLLLPLVCIVHTLRQLATQPVAPIVYLASTRASSIPYQSHHHVQVQNKGSVTTEPAHHQLHRHLQMCATFTPITPHLEALRRVPVYTRQQSRFRSLPLRRPNPNQPF